MPGLELGKTYKGLWHILQGCKEKTDLQAGHFLLQQEIRCKKIPVEMSFSTSCITEAVGKQDLQGLKKLSKSRNKTGGHSPIEGIAKALRLQSDPFIIITHFLVTSTRSISWPKVQLCQSPHKDRTKTVLASKCSLCVPRGSTRGQAGEGAEQHNSCSSLF